MVEAVMLSAVVLLLVILIGVFFKIRQYQIIYDKNRFVSATNKYRVFLMNFRKSLLVYLEFSGKSFTHFG